MTQAEIEAKAAADKAAAEAAAAEAGKVEKKDEDKTAEELKAEAEELERQIKERKEGASEEEIRTNMLRRKEKAAEKLERLKNGGDKETKQEGEIATRDLITLGQNNIEEGSEQAQILQKYVKAGICKDYKEALTHVGVKAELEAVKAKTTTKTVIDENDTDEVKLNTRKEIISNYEASGEVPTDPKAQKEIAKHNLKKMGL